MPIPTKMADLSTLAASNSPAGSDPVGNSLDDYLRAHAAILRSTNAEASAPIVSASTTDIGAADAEAVTVSGSATITSLGVAPAGLRREVKFTGTPTLTNGSNLVLNGANIAVQANDVHTFRSEGGGVWRLVASKRPLIVSAQISDAPWVALTGAQTVAGAKAFTDNVTVRRVTPRYVLEAPAGINGYILDANVSDGVFGGLRILRRDNSAVLFDINNAGQITGINSVTASSLAGTGTRPVVANSSGTESAQDAATFRTTIGLGTMATQAATSYAALAGAAFTGAISSTASVSDLVGNVRDIPVITRNSSTAFAATDRGQAIVKDNTTAYSWTVNTGVFTAGMAIPVINDGSAGDVTIVQGAGMTVIAGTTTGNFTLAPGESRTLHALSATRVRVL